MKIAFVTPYYEPSIGGVQRYVKDLVHAYADDHDIVIITTRTMKAEPAVETHGRVTIYRLPVLLRLSNTPFHPLWKRHFRRIFSQEQPDVIHAHAPIPWFADIAERANASRIPFVLTYHSGSMRKGSGIADSIIGTYERFVLPKTLRSVTRIAAVYPAFIEQLLGTTRHIAHITPGIDTERYRPKHTPIQYDLLFAGRLEASSAWKGLDIALCALAQLKKDGHAYRLAIAGGGDAKAHYEARARELAIDSQVTFLGPLGGTSMRDTYRASRCLVLPSTTEAESFGIVAAEAASCGVPAIGSHIGGVPHTISDMQTGLLVPAGDVAELARSIHTLLSDEARRQQYGDAARARAVDTFSLDTTVTRTLQLYEAALVSRRPKNIQVVAYYPPALGGMERVAENIAVELAANGETTEVVTSQIGQTSSHTDEQATGYRVTRLWGTMVGGLPVIPSLLWHLLRQPRGSLYHVHVAQAFIPEITLLATKLRGGKYVAHFHLDVVPSGAFGAIFALYKRTLFPIMLRHADRVLVFSRDQRELVATHYGVDDARIATLPNGIRRGFLREDNKPSHTPSRLLFVGRLSHQKNLTLLLDALDGISADYDTHIVGDGELRAELEAYAKKLHLEHVTFTGRKDDAALRQEYEDADIFVLPSEREGMPLVLIDAMAMRLPAVGTDVLGIRDMISHGTNGLLAPLDDVEAFRRQIETLAGSTELYSRLSEQAFDSVRELTWPHLTKRLVEEVYA